MKVNVHKIHQFKGHKDSIYALSAGEQPNIFYSSGGDGLVARWDLESKDDGQVIAKVDGSVYALHFLETKNYLVIGQNNFGLHFVDPESKESVKSLKFTESIIFDIKANGDEIYVACGDGKLIVLDIQTYELISSLNVSSQSLRSITVNPEGNNLLVGASDNQIYNIEEKNIKPIQGHSNSVFKVVFSNDGQSMISGGRDAQLKIWDTHNNFHLIESIPAHMFTVNDISFTSDNLFFASGSKDKTIKIWDFNKRKLVKVIDHSRHGGHLSSVNKLIWTKYNNFIISGSDDRTICVWDLELND